jgi:hypothetical protein
MAFLRKRSCCQISEAYDVCGGGIDGDGILEQDTCRLQLVHGTIAPFYNNKVPVKKGNLYYN